MTTYYSGQIEVVINLGDTVFTMSRSIIDGAWEGTVESAYEDSSKMSHEQCLQAIAGITKTTVIVDDL